MVSNYQFASTYIWVTVAVAVLKYVFLLLLKHIYDSILFLYVQIRKEALWAGFAMKPDHEAMITVCLLITCQHIFFWTKKYIDQA